MHLRKTAFVPAIACVLLLAAGCASRGAPVDRPRARELPAVGPYGAIWMAANAAPRPVPGVFELTIRQTGVEDGYSFLNSELDYRDPRNLSVRLAPPAMRALGADADTAVLQRYVGKRLRVLGDVRRTRIDFIVDGRPSGKYYYQTHLPVADVAQIQVLDAGRTGPVRP